MLQNELTSFRCSVRMCECPLGCPVRNARANSKGPTGHTSEYCVVALCRLEDERIRVAPGSWRGPSSVAPAHSLAGTLMSCWCCDGNAGINAPHGDIEDRFDTPPTSAISVSQTRLPFKRPHRISPFLEAPFPESVGCKIRWPKLRRGIVSGPHKDCCLESTPAPTGSQPRRRAHPKSVFQSLREEMW